MAASLIQADTRPPQHGAPLVCRQDESRDQSREGGAGLWITVAVILVVAAPTLFLSYLPMTDVPQHLAIVSILEHFADPHYGFSEFYQMAFQRTFYVLPYLVAWGLAKLIPLQMAMRVVIFLSLIAYPLGILAVLRALGKPALLGLLTVPLIYNQYFFWGFLGFNLSVGMALAACALLIRCGRSAMSDLALAGLCVAIVATHLYGIAILLGYLVLWSLIGRRRELLRRMYPIAPACAGLLAWVWTVGQGAEYLVSRNFPPLSARFYLLDESVLGGYQDKTEKWLLFGLLVTLLVLSFRSLPVSRKRWMALLHHERVIYAYITLNLFLYFILPDDVASVAYICFRHAFLAVALMPLVVPAGALEEFPRLSRTLLSLLVAVTLVNSYVHLTRFDREAQAFDRVVEQLPDRPKVLALTWENNGAVMRTHPYLHFSAYIQAKKGGLISSSFPRMAWNMPIGERKDAGIPPSPLVIAWCPLLFDYREFGYYYDFVLVRIDPEDTSEFDELDEFPYELFHELSPWRLYRASAGGRAAIANPIQLLRRLPSSEEDGKGHP